MGLVLPAPTPFNTIVSNWANQSYNAVINYGNRNASSKYTTQDILKSYILATGSSVFVALGIRKGLEPWTKKMVGAKLLLANSFSAMVALGNYYEWGSYDPNLMKPFSIDAP